MALTHAKPGQPINLAPLGDELTAVATHALLKTHSLELIRLVLRADQTMPLHELRGEMTLLCIEGSVDITLPGSHRVLNAQQLLLLPARVPHSVRALENSSLLLTIQTPAGAPGSASATH